jgi:hypothetical protein
MTYAPADLLAVRQYLMGQTGLPANALGIPGDPDHAETGGYHEGNDDLARVGRLTSDYSKRESPRDRPGSNAASALDIGDFRHVRPDGTVVTLRSLSLALVHACAVGVPGTADVREVIYTPDGSTVRRFDQLGIRSTGDSSHLYHTHISFFRDSEGRRAQPDNILGLIQALIEGDGMPYEQYDRDRLSATYDAVKRLEVQAAADAARDASAKVAIDALSAAVAKGGGSVDSAAIIARMDAIAEVESTTVAALRAEVVSLRAALAAGAQAGADALSAG